MLRSIAIATGVTIAAALGTPAATADTSFVAAKSCGFEFLYSAPSVYPPVIRGNGVAQCDAPPNEHVLTLSLEYRSGDSWVTASAKTDKEIPPGPPRYKSYEVSAACYAGTWRVSVSVAGSIQGNPFVFSEHSETRDISTSKCPSR